MLLVSPERLNNPGFRDEVLPRLAATAGLVVIDEAHCISDWGHDFRPDYRRIRTLLTDLPPGIPVLATTATANARVTADVAEQLQVADSAPVLVLRGTLDRESLHLGVVRLPDQPSRLAWLAQHLPELPGSGIIYCLTVAATEQVADFLRGNGFQVAAYSGQTEQAERLQAEEDLLENRVKALVATSALGMGFDKPDLGFVVHLGAPARRSPTTSRSAAPAAAWSAPPWCCCPAARTRTSGTTSARWRSPANSTCCRPCPSWSRPGGRCRCPRWNRGSSSSGRGWR